VTPTTEQIGGFLGGKNGFLTEIGKKSKREDRGWRPRCIFIWNGMVSDGKKGGDGRRGGGVDLKENSLMLRSGTRNWKGRGGAVLLDQECLTSMKRGLARKTVLLTDVSSWELGDHHRRGFRKEGVSFDSWRPVTCLLGKLPHPRKEGLHKRSKGPREESLRISADYQGGCERLW